jgi:hypothetical protein
MNQYNVTRPMRKSFEIDKVTAGRNMFKEAALLFYERRCQISIHHLAHASHEVLRTITGDSHLFI